MLGFYHHRSVVLESRDDVLSVAREYDTPQKSVDFQGRQVVQHQLDLKKKVAKVHGEVDEAKGVALKLKTKLVEAQAKLSQLKRAHQTQQEEHFLKMHDILFNQIPGYRNAIPPIQYDVVESEDQVGPYQLYDCLGRGTFAKVLVCQHERTRKLHAIKCLDKSKFSNTKELTQLAREIRVLKSNFHRNVVGCKEIIHAAKHLYLVMDLSYCDLFDYTREHRGFMTDPAYREIITGLLEGLECLHDHGIAHLDLKPENVLIARKVPPEKLTSQDIRICDFGLCQVAENPRDEIKVTCILGTPGFISPELMLLNSKEGEQYEEGRMADMWGVGIIMLELLEGLPNNWFNICNASFYKDIDDQRFYIEFREELFKIHEFRDFPCISGNDLMRRLLRWRPEARYNALQALQHPWLNPYDDGSFHECNE
jgi:serine/threonine protein kinase